MALDQISDESINQLIYLCFSSLITQCRGLNK